MVDGSHLPYEENLALTRQAVEMARSTGAWVEAELGAVPADEDRSTNAIADDLTTPERAAEFAAETEIDALAVAVGNVHGFTEVAPVIDLARLEAISREVCLPLVLHGASGLARDVLRACLQRGVAKVNVNAQLRNVFMTTLAEHLPAAMSTCDLTRVLSAGRAAVACQVTELVSLLGPNEPAYSGSAGARAAGRCRVLRGPLYSTPLFRGRPNVPIGTG